MLDRIVRNSYCVLTFSCIHDSPMDKRFPSTFLVAFKRSQEFFKNLCCFFFLLETLHTQNIISVQCFTVYQVKYEIIVEYNVFLQAICVSSKYEIGLISLINMQHNVDKCNISLYVVLAGNLYCADDIIPCLVKCSQKNQTMFIFDLFSNEKRMIPSYYIAIAIVSHL